jgi:hypothetical protein
MMKRYENQWFHLLFLTNYLYHEGKKNLEGNVGESSKASAKNVKNDKILAHSYFGTTASSLCLATCHTKNLSTLKRATFNRSLFLRKRMPKSFDYLCDYKRFNLYKNLFRL